MINARMETITEKPSFKAAAARRRCPVPADGYFEWEKRDGAKVPHFLHGDGVLGMAARGNPASDAGRLARPQPDRH